MLNRYEIERIAKEKGEPARIIEKDYLLEMVLFLIQEQGSGLVFKGGTALYKLHSLNRLSEDLDFTLSGKLHTEKLVQGIMRKLKRMGIHGRIKEIESYRNQQNIRIELRGPLFDGNPQNTTRIVLNVSMKEKPLYKAREEHLYPAYRDIPAFSVAVMPLQEILAEKVRALFTRNKPRDVYDIWFLLKKGVKTTIQDINRKLKLYGEVYSEEKCKEKVDEKRKSWTVDLKPLVKGELPDFEAVRKEILENLALL